MIKQILSYLIPIVLYKRKSKLSKSLEVLWNKGELVIDSENTNYSYGDLQRILKIGLLDIGFEKIVRMNHILVLGVAGGSVVKTLIEDIQFKGKITGVEIDPEIIKIANKYFNLKDISQLNIVIDDAFEFVLKTKDKYDLIIVDVFQDTQMPNFLYQNYFTDRICSLLNSKGYILFNTMLLDKKQNLLNETYISSFKKENFSIRAIPRVEKHNELIVIERTH
ncbi:fused MFS/spermidine synthase [Flavobacterium sp. NG2]|uniref:spermidine synthase n=1 Tax=Flavobacterium sp. NG2 TaxID=3097547 RepID=UPI002A7F0DF3|nr:fused MFS/spermidine synthase [Flavobacterium sp. NG2]WPR70678.1 fused MFS/spermidine synthase [Flavobacterium sp. NG2]